MLAVPAVRLAEVLLTYFLPEYVFEFDLNGTQAMMLTHFGEVGGQIMSAKRAGNHLAFPINTQILTYSFPLYIALTYVTTGRGNLAGCRCRTCEN